MRPRSVAYLVLAIAIGVFVIANWSVIDRSTEINFLVARVSAPLGLLILVIAALIVLIAFISHTLTLLAWSKERRGLAREVERQRARADEVEQSHVKELRDYLGGETRTIREQLDRVMESLSRK